MLTHNPPHPGEVLREFCLEPLGLSVTAVAEALGVSPQIVECCIERQSWYQPGNGCQALYRV